jgi:hypothetical protein
MVNTKHLRITLQPRPLPHHHHTNLLLSIMRVRRSDQLLILLLLNMDLRDIHSLLTPLIRHVSMNSSQNLDVLQLLAHMLQLAPFLLWTHLLDNLVIKDILLYVPSLLHRAFTLSHPLSR